MTKLPTQLPTKINYMPAFLLMASAAVILLAPDLSFAGTGGTEFAGAATRLQGIIEGSGGKVAAVFALIIAVAASVHQFSVKHIGSAIGVGIMASVGVAAVETGITGLI